MQNVRRESQMTGPGSVWNAVSSKYCRMQKTDGRTKAESRNDRIMTAAATMARQNPAMNRSLRLSTESGISTGKRRDVLDGSTSQVAASSATGLRAWNIGSIWSATASDSTVETRGLDFASSISEIVPMRRYDIRASRACERFCRIR